MSMASLRWYRPPRSRQCRGSRPVASVCLQAACCWFLMLRQAFAASRLDVEPELASEQVKQEAVLEVKYARTKAKYGLRDRRTLDVFFELFDLWIMLYRLNKADAALQEVLPACEWRRDDYSIKAVQALAFTRWKQGAFREALSRFHEMEGWLGKNAALSENIGHTYNTLGRYEDAQRYFQEALVLTRQLPDGSGGNEGGILLGLAGVQERRDMLTEALPTSQQAYNFFKARDVARGWPTSLTAKAAMQLSKVYFRRDAFAEAEKYAREAAQNFESTAGADSPLVAGAFERLGAVLVKQGRREEAQQALHRAYQVEAIKDKFDLVQLLEIHNQLVDAHVGTGGLDRAAFRKYFKVVSDVVARVRSQMKQDGNAGAYYKAAGELYVLGSDCDRGRPLLVEAITLFKDETSVDTSGLIKSCKDLVAFCNGGR
eukprot:TRINITY_DN18924_c0_g1_i2.p1 TRINITY_DN18924_c0_g1~~TRINITY_DN18924_c0_g1_i2.p1  ORF type:complete len:430 (-),score=100.13 TRINITY_DN18924_c0_g1_i2:56-1345(-)